MGSLDRTIWTLYGVTFLVFNSGGGLTGVHAKAGYAVIYPDNAVCAVRRSSVSLPCYYSYPETSHVTQKLWCSMNSNSDLCENPPYVYNSALNTDSNYQFIGDDQSDCSLLIRNVQFNHSGVYKFRFRTNEYVYTGTPGVTVHVTDVTVSPIRLSGNGTLKQGDSLNLTCDANCTDPSSLFVWIKDDQRLPESGPVLHFPALTTKDSGNYTCFWETDKTLGYDEISLHVEGVYPKAGYAVIYPDNVVCAVRKSSVSLPCYYSYPETSHVTQKLWCSMNSNSDLCENPPYVYNSALNTDSNYHFIGDDQSHCRLLIRNVQFNHSGVYKFRFRTNEDVYTGTPGVTVHVTDVTVSPIRLSGNGTLKQGDSLNLTCDVNCTDPFSLFVWTKDDQLLPESGPVLHFPALTTKDSGNYTCTWQTDKTSDYDTISLHVEGVYAKAGYAVIYPDNVVCAVRRSSVSLPCYYSYPETSHVTQKLWCSMNSNSDLCENPPYVYNSALNTDSNYHFIGDDQSDCSLLIRNVQFNHSGVYKFRFITDEHKYTREHGVTVHVTDVTVSPIRLSGNGTLKQGDSLNLTCDVNCTDPSSLFVWTKDDQRLLESRPVLHFPALTTKDSGNYTCTWLTDKTSGYDTISLHVEGVYAEDDYAVIYPDNVVCAVRRSSVSLPCYYSYPETSHVTQKLWCSMNSNSDLCENPPYVYNSALNTDSNYHFIGDDQSDCSLLIRNVQFNHSGVYKFRFRTNEDVYTGTHGVTVRVTDVTVSPIRLSGNGTFKQGDSLNLTCDVNCTDPSSLFVWTKDDQRLPESGPILHFPALTANGSGNYTCTWQTDKTSGYDTISLHVEDFKQDESGIIILSVLVILVIMASVAALIFYRSRRRGTYEVQSFPLAAIQGSEL